MSHRSRARLLAAALTTVLTATLTTGLAGVGSMASAATPRDTGLLAFARQNQIYTATQSGTSVRKLTASGKNYRPHWSPDGKRIAYVHETTGNVRNIWVMNADGSNKQQVTRQQHTSEPAWSPDGRWIAFGGDATPGSTNDGRLQKVRSTAPFGTPVAFAADASDSGVEPVVSGQLDWSADGTRIVYTSYYFPSSPDLYLLVYTLATRDVVDLDAIGGGCCGGGTFADPVWTRDGSSVALSYLRYEYDDEVIPNSTHLEILRYPRPSGPTTSPYPNVTGDSDPDYSPTGRKLVFSHYSRIYTSDATGAHRRNVLAGYHPDWQPAFG